MRSSHPAAAPRRAAALIALGVVSLAVLASAGKPKLPLLVSFGPPDALPVSTDYTVDHGAPYSDDVGWGWVVSATDHPLNMSKQMYKRTQPSEDTLLCSFALVQHDVTTSAWPAQFQVAVDNGSYLVLLSVGDNDELNSVYAARAEGLAMISNFTPTDTERFRSANVTVNVTDGFLTIGPGVGGHNTKINYVEVYDAPEATPSEQPSGGTLPTQVSADSSDGLTITNEDVIPFPNFFSFNRIQSTYDNPSTASNATLIARNDGKSDLTVSGISFTGDAAGNFDFVDGGAPTLPVKLAPGDTLTVPMLFTADAGYSYKNRAYEGLIAFEHDGPNGPSTSARVSGIWQARSESGTEPDLATVVQVSGFNTVVVYSNQSIHNEGRVETAGQEILSSYWHRADSTQPVVASQLASYHTCCNNPATLYWTEYGKTGGTTVFTTNPTWAQSVRPRIDGSEVLHAWGEFEPTDDTFGFRVDSEYSDHNLNNKVSDDCSGGPDTCGQHVRFWPAIDAYGNNLTNTYLMSMDYLSVNYDYNDNLYLLQNIVPAFQETTSS